jgi:hypothetical protein
VGERGGEDKLVLMIDAASVFDASGLLLSPVVLGGAFFL